MGNLFLILVESKFKGVFQFVVVGGFSFQGIKGSVKEKQQIEKPINQNI